MKGPFRREIDVSPLSQYVHFMSSCVQTWSLYSKIHKRFEQCSGMFEARHLDKKKIYTLNISKHIILYLPVVIHNGFNLNGNPHREAKCHTFPLLQPDSDLSLSLRYSEVRETRTAAQHLLVCKRERYIYIYMYITRPINISFAPS